MNSKKMKAPCTILLLVANAAVFFLLSVQGATEDGLFMLEYGAMYVPFITEQGEYYRMFTSMFLHFGFEHLFNNMITLALIGWNLEVEIGSIRFLVIYILSGLGGNILSSWWDIRLADYAISAGASGAIFGIIGALLYVVIRNRGWNGDISGRGIVFMIFITLYYGYSSGGVDNMAHIGGLATGFLLCVLLYWKHKREDSSFIQY